MRGRPGRVGLARRRRVAAFSVEPAEERPRRHDGDQLFERRPERPAELDQPAAFLRRHLDDARQLGAQDLVLDFEELDVAGQRPVGRLGQKQQQSVDRGAHRELPS